MSGRNQDFTQRGTVPELCAGPLPSARPMASRSPTGSALPMRPVRVVQNCRYVWRVYILDTLGIAGSPGTALILNANPNRTYLFLQNLSGAGTIALGYDQTPVAQGAVLLGQNMGPGGFFEPNVAPDNAVYAIASAPGTQLFALEGIAQGMTP